MAHVLYQDFLKCQRGGEGTDNIKLQRRKTTASFYELMSNGGYQRRKKEKQENRRDCEMEK